MKKSKKKFIIIISIIIIAILSALVIYFFKDSRENSLTLEENQWIESNKQNVIDTVLINNIPILSYDGQGIIYDYLDYVSKELSLQFNVIPYMQNSENEYDYKMEIKNTPSKNDLIFLKDNMVLITKENIEYDNLEKIDNLKLGIYSEDSTLLKNYFNGKNISFTNYDTYEQLKNAIVTDATNEIDGIIISKVLFTKEMIENDYTISFQFNDLNKYFVLTLNGNSTLNNILKKNYNNFKDNEYDSRYNSLLLDNYFNFKKVADGEQKKLMSKSYEYGFVNYGIYNYLNKDKISGLSSLILKEFNKFSGISISYTQYNSISKLLQDFNSNNVDFILNISDSKNYLNSIYETSGIFNKKLIIVSGNMNDDVIDGMNSIKDKQVSIIKDSYLEDYLIKLGAKVKLYNNMEDLSKDFNDNSLAVMDLENYNFYKTSSLKNSKINYIVNDDGKYNFIINDTDDNKVFEDLFNFYISYIPVKELIVNNYEDVAYENTNIAYILVCIIIILCLYILIDFSNHFKYMLKALRKNKKIHLSKEEKIKYIDQLTSLKNRAYLNSRIESWDESEIYPQTIIIIDLNNISYINDNYGREEGDKVITEAANILIMNQLQNSDIIRTDGNEFLIYLVGYSEKQIIAYLRKLNKELKGLSHGFGAASGYSIINDAIKTIDDAVNEATLDMKNNKEDINY